MKLCGKCQITKNDKEFYRRASNKDGLQPWCKNCCEDYRRKSPEIRVKSQQRKYKRKGFDPAEIQRTLIKQKGKCAICGSNNQRMCADHDHVTGKFRGVLCNNCNRALGLLRDNALYMERAADYVRGIALEPVEYPD